MTNSRGTVEPEIIFENKDFLILNKPAGMLVHGVRIRNKELGIREKEEEKEALTSWLVDKYPEIKEVGDAPEERPGIVHRLDRATSGIMLVPRNQEYFLYLKSLFQEHKIQKTYLALVFGKFSAKKGIINDPIGIKSGTTKRSIHSTKMQKEAVTEYEVVKSIKYKVSGIKYIEFSLVKVWPRTGRTHQIRVHLSSIGHPILGDELYGKSKKKLEVSRLMLHALSLEFSSREGEKLKFEAEVPEDFQKVLDDLRSV